MEVAPFFVDFHHFLSIFTIYALLSRFTFFRDLRTFSAIFFGQNSLHRNITRFLHVCITHTTTLKMYNVHLGIMGVFAGPLKYDTKIAILMILYNTVRFHNVSWGLVVPLTD